MPLPIALGDRTGLSELNQRPNAAAKDSSTRPWKNRAGGREWRYGHPAFVERIDDVVARHQLPRAQHLRVAAPHAADAILRGATSLVRHPSFKSVLVTAASSESGSALSDLLIAAGLSLADTRQTRGAGRLLLFVSQSIASI
jgi:hypothetical protein